MSKKRIVFSGYAPVHFVCFQPLYRRLVRHRNIEVYLSGEARADDEKRVETLYRPFRVPRDRVIPLAELQRRSFDMVMCAHVSGYFPRYDRDRVQLFHGLSFRNVAARRDVLVFDHLFITGRYMMRRFLDRQLLRKDDPKLVPIGFPKVDRLVDGTLNRRKILSKLGFSGRRPVVLYAPTGQKHNSLDIGVGEEVIARLKALRRYDIIIKLHDHPREQAVNWRKQLRSVRGPHTKLVTDFDIVPYLFASDLLITDASSVSSEYSLLDRPMVFLDVPDLIALARRKGHAVDLETWGRRGGETVRWPDEAVDAVECGLAHPSDKSDIRRRMAGDLFYNPGCAAEAAERWVLDRLGLAKRLGEAGRVRADRARCKLVTTG